MRQNEHKRSHDKSTNVRMARRPQPEKINGHISIAINFSCIDARVHMQCARDSALDINFISPLKKNVAHTQRQRKREAHNIDDDGGGGGDDDGDE